MMYAENKHAQVVYHDLPVTGTHRFSDAQRYCLKHRTCATHCPLCAQTSEGKWPYHREVQLPWCTPGNIHAKNQRRSDSRRGLMSHVPPSKYTSQTHIFLFSNRLKDIFFFMPTDLLNYYVPKKPPWPHALFYRLFIDFFDCQTTGNQIDKRLNLFARLIIVWCTQNGLTIYLPICLPR